MSINILIISDITSDKNIIDAISNEYCVLTANNEADAIRILNDHDKVHLLLLDLNIPNMNGLEFLESIKKNEQFRNLRTIILTSHDESENKIRGLKLGSIDYIRKPVYKNSLKARIDIHTALIHAEAAEEHQLSKHALTIETIFNQAPIGIAISHNCDPDDSDRGFVEVNPVFEQITGRTKEELTRLGWAKITHPDDLEKDMENFKKLISGEISSYSMDKRYIKPDGSVVWVHMIASLLDISKDQQYNYVCLVQDITERKTIEKALEESERSKSVLLHHLPGLAYRCNNDKDWTMQYVSKGCLNLTGYPPESLLHNRDISFNDIISPEYRESLRNEWDRVLAEKLPFKYEYEIITATGEKKWVLEMGQGIFNDEGEVEALEGIILDISDRKAIEDTLKYNNEHDKWTGLYNREYLVSLLEKDFRKKKNIKKALIGINLSMVQLLAANYGFQYLQNLIKKAAEALSQYCTDNRILFQTRESRFVFYILDYKDKNELFDFGNLIANTLESLFVTERIGGGIGIIEIDQNQNEADIESLLRRLVLASDKCVCPSEKNFDICFYDEKLESLVNRERDIIEALNDIAMNQSTNNILYLQYQPILDLKTGLICGFEALSRLKTEKLGGVSPLEFIPIAEKTKLILPIGEKVIINAFRFLKRLNEHGYDDIYVSINISIIELLKPDFASRLFELIDEMQVNPKNIGIEITESIFASDYNKINNILKQLRDVGIHIAIDDFGTGYSSLAREKELKVDYLKIDKYFADKLLHPDKSKAIICDIISMSHRLGHHAITEGVEHEIQLEYLKKHNCDKIQGYLISKPLDEEDAIKFLEKQGQK